MARFFLFLVFTLAISSVLAQLNITEIRNKSMESVIDTLKVIKSLPELLTNQTNSFMASVSQNVNGTELNSTNENKEEPEIFASKSDTGVLQAVPKLKVALGEKCDSVDDCKHEGASCINHNCTCKNSHVLSTSKHSCLLIASEIGGTCSEDHQCSKDLGETICVNFNCRCAERYKFVSGRCVGHKILGISCSNDTDCNENGKRDRVCRSGVCVCPEGYLPSPDDNDCLPEAKNINETCNLPSQCDHLGEASCREGICVCKPLAHFLKEKGKCAAVKALGEECDDKEECAVSDEPGKRDCVNNKCVCVKGIQDEDICKDSATSLTVGMGILLMSVNLFL